MLPCGTSNLAGCPLKPNLSNTPLIIPSWTSPIWTRNRILLFLPTNTFFSIISQKEQCISFCTRNWQFSFILQFKMPLTVFTTFFFHIQLLRFYGELYGTRTRDARETVLSDNRFTNSPYGGEYGNRTHDEGLQSPCFPSKLIPLIFFLYLFFPFTYLSTPI